MKTTRRALRLIAIVAARARLRECGVEPSEVTMREVEDALEHIRLTQPDTIAAQYYASIGADIDEWKRFKKEWRSELRIR